MSFIDFILEKLNLSYENSIFPIAHAVSSRSALTHEGGGQGAAEMKEWEGTGRKPTFLRQWEVGKEHWEEQ